MSHKEKENLSHLLKQAKQKRQQQQQNRWAKGAAIAREQWEAAALCIDHSYLTRKAVASYRLRVDRAGNLLVPIYHNGELCSLQTINADGYKRFLKGGKITGAYFTIGEIKGAASLLICEGCATYAGWMERICSLSFVNIFLGRAVTGAFNERLFFLFG